MAVNVMPKSTKYSLVWTGGSLELATDPRGWQEDAVAFSRDENHGINVQNVVALSFSGAAKDKIKEFYDTYGAYAKMSVSIDKRNNLWELNSWYQYRLDFKTYKETKNFVEISGIEEGLLSSVQKFADTEYEINLPTKKTFLNYSGVSIYKKNQIQALYGRIYKKDSIVGSNRAYVLGGKRAVRTYSPDISYTNTAGNPYETMSLRAVNPISGLSINLNLKLTVNANGTLRNPSSGVLRVYKHDSNFANATLISESPRIAKTTSVTSSKRRDVFNWVATINSISLTAGQMVSVFYIADGGTYDRISVDEAQKAYIENGILTENQYNNSYIEVFNYEWLIESLIKVIYPNAIFKSQLSYNDYKLLLSATPCIYNLGNLFGVGNLKSKLSDALKSLNCFKMIGIDIQFDEFTIYPLQSLYSPTANINTIEAKDITLEHDSTHQYKKVKVGSKVNERGEDGDMVYPFIVEKEFEVTDCEFDAELDLVNPFIVDPYDVDDYIKDTLSNDKNTDKCDFLVFACVDNISQLESEVVYRNFVPDSVQRTSSNTLLHFYGYDPGEPMPIVKRKDPYVNLGYDGNSDGLWFDEPMFQYEFFNKNSFYRVVIEIDVLLDNRNPAITSNFGIDNNVTNYAISLIENTEIRGSHSYYRKIDMIMKTEQDEGASNVLIIFNFDMDNQDWMDINTFKFEALRSDSPSPFDIYRGHTIISGTDQQADNGTLYNIPLTPKRILQTWDSYLKISVFGNPTGKYKFLTSKYKNTALTTKCDFESANVVEEADFTPISTTPIFQPKICTFTAAKKYEGDTVFIPKKYERYRVVDSKRGLTYTGWIKDFTFGLNKAKEQDYVLQIQSIT